MQYDNPNDITSEEDLATNPGANKLGSAQPTPAELTRTAQRPVDVQPVLTVEGQEVTGDFMTPDAQPSYETRPREVFPTEYR
jgi:hypothetical protein